jgi:hypothetical protein
MVLLHDILSRFKGLVLFIGVPRSGKTSLMVALASAVMSLWHNGGAYYDCKRFVKRLNAGGYNLTVPRKHAVYSDVPFLSRDAMSYKYVPYRVEIDNLYLPEDPPFVPSSEAGRLSVRGIVPDVLSRAAALPESVFLPPYATCLFDESSRYFDRGDTAKGYPRSFVRLLETLGHWHLSLYFSCHRDVSLPAFLRDLCALVVAPEVVAVKSYGLGCRTVWRVRLFRSVSDYTCYIDGGERAGKLCEALDLYVPYNVFMCYNPTHFFPLYLRGREHSDFASAPVVSSGYTVEGINAFCGLKPMPSRFDGSK